MLSAEGSQIVAKRRVMVREREASEGRLSLKVNATQADPLNSKLDDSHSRAGAASLEQTAKLHELSRENLKL